MVVGFASQERTSPTEFLFWCSDKIPQPKKLTGEKIYLSSQFTVVILSDRESSQGLDAVGQRCIHTQKAGSDTPELLSPSTSYTAQDHLVRKRCHPLWADLPTSSHLIGIILQRRDWSLSPQLDYWDQPAHQIPVIFGPPTLLLWPPWILALPFSKGGCLSVPGMSPDLSPPRTSPLLFSIFDTLFARLVFRTQLKWLCRNSLPFGFSEIQCIFTQTASNRRTFEVWQKQNYFQI